MGILVEIAPFVMVVMISLIVTIGKNRRARDAALNRADGNETDEALRLRGEVTRLNERIQVLERLATDPAKRLSDQIDALDDHRK